MNRPTKQDVQQKYLCVLHKRNAEGKPFSHREMSKAMGWRSVASSWNMTQELIRLGLMEPGQQVVSVKAPVITKAGSKLLRRAA